MLKRFLLLIMVLSMGSIAFAQQIEPVTPPTGSETMAITYPVPVLSLSGNVTIAGTASTSGLSNYFVEFRPLQVIPTEETPVEGQWFPATLPSTRPVTNDVLGVWNTETAPDGMYELRLVVIAGGTTDYFRVSPVRVLNNPEALSPFASVANVQPTASSGFGGGAAATQAALATLFAFQNTQNNPNAQPTAAAGNNPSSGPQAVSLTNANVRRGDSVAYPTVGSLLTNDRAPILGVSSSGSGWYYIQLDNGRNGFISPSVVRVEGSIIGVPAINPPPVPATPTPLPTATPVASGDLVLSGLRTEPAVPVCLNAFNVFVNIVNNGSAATTSGGNLQVIDRHVSSGTVTTSGVVAFPTLNPGQNWVVVVPLNVGTYFNESHELLATVNYDGAVAETNRGNNTFSMSYTLAQGGC